MASLANVSTLLWGLLFQNWNLNSKIYQAHLKVCISSFKTIPRTPPLDQNWGSYDWSKLGCCKAFLPSQLGHGRAGTQGFMSNSWCAASVKVHGQKSLWRKLQFKKCWTSKLFIEVSSTTLMLGLSSYDQSWKSYRGSKWVTWADLPKRTRAGHDAYLAGPNFSLWQTTLWSFLDALGTSFPFHFNTNLVYLHVTFQLQQKSFKLVPCSSRYNPPKFISWT